MKKVWIAVLLFSQVFFTVTSARVLASVLTTIIGGQVDFVVTPWLSGWDNRVKITIDHNDVDSVLSNFPVLIYLSNSSGRDKDDVTFVFDEVGPNSKKIAVTTSDGTKQCYVEVEKWNSTSEEAWLWVKVPSISNTSDTDLYLYYDKDHANNTNVGDTGSTTAEKVWDSNYKMVHHLQYDPSGSAPQEIDSTSNHNNGTSEGSMTSDDQVEGKIDGSLDFDGTDDRINCGNASSLNNLSKLTWEVLLNKYSASLKLFINKGSGLQARKWAGVQSDNTIRSVIQAGTDANSISTDTISLNEWHYIVITYDDEGDRKIHIFLDGNEVSYDTQTAASGTLYDDSTHTLFIGHLLIYPFDGKIDEVRISNIVRSAAWIKASNETERDDLLDFVL